MGPLIPIAPPPPLTVGLWALAPGAHGLGDVLLPTDDPEASAAAVEHAVALVASTGATLHVLQAADTNRDEA